MGVVLAVRVGRPRPFWQGFGLAVVTFGFYSYYWDFKTQDELYKQFELAREGREQGVVWYIMGFLLPVLRFVYFAHYVGNVRYLRTRFGFGRSLSIGRFLGLAIPAAVAFYVGVLLGLVLALSGVAADPATGGVVVTNADRLDLGFSIAVLSFLAYVVLYAVAYFLLQRDVNEVWSAYDARAAALMAGARAQAAGWLPVAGTGVPAATAPGAPPPAAPPAPAPTGPAWGAPPWRPPPPR